MIHTIYWSALDMDWHMHGLELPVQRPGNHRLENRMSSKTTIFLVFAALLAAGAAVFAQTGSFVPVVTGNARVDKLLSQMTLEEKTALLHGGPEASPSGVGQAGTWPGLPRLGIPSLRLVDGPPGISISIWSTGMTATMGLGPTQK